MSAESKPNDLVEQNLSFVVAIAREIHARMPGHVELDDLISWGNFGLIDAAKKYDPTRENKFKTYAHWRIRGAILDGLRDQDLTSRSVRDLEKTVVAAKNDFRVSYGRLPAPEELAKTLNVDIEKLHEIELRIHPIRSMSIGAEDLFTSDDRKALLVSSQNNSQDMIAKISAMEKLTRIVSGQPPIERACFMLKYIWGFEHQEIAEVFGCSPSRISQRMNRVRLDRKP